MTYEFKAIGSKKCCNCSLVKPVFKAFAQESGYRSRWSGRKPQPVFWCEPCWTETAKQMQAEREQRDREIREHIASFKG